jgi:hypothetical protein
VRIKLVVCFDSVHRNTEGDGDAVARNRLSIELGSLGDGTRYLVLAFTHLDFFFHCQGFHFIAIWAPPQSFRAGLEPLGTITWWDWLLDFAGGAALVRWDGLRDKWLAAASEDETKSSEGCCLI